MNLLLLQWDDAPGWIWFIVFFVLPLVARLLKWLAEKAGLSTPEGKPAAELRDKRARDEALRRRREERRREEEAGEDLWRRLARGELVEPPPAPPPPVRPAPVPVARTVPIEPRARETSLELESEPVPLSVLGEVSEPAEASETSLETESAPLALEALATAPAVETARARPAFVLARGDLRRGMILVEILGPPVADRPLRA